MQTRRRFITSSIGRAAFIAVGGAARASAQEASANEIVARKPSAAFDGKWGNGCISPDLFTWLVYRGV